MASGADVQAKIDEGLNELEHITASPVKYIQQHGTDWTKWTTTDHMFKAFSSFHAARDEVSQLAVPTPLKAEFEIK